MSANSGSATETAAAISAPPASTYRPSGAEKAETVVLGSTEGEKESPFRMEVVLSGRGAGIKTVNLSDHKQNVEAEERYRLLSPVEVDDQDPWLSLVIEKITIDNHKVNLSDLPWKVVCSETDGSHIARFLATIINEEDIPVVELVRTFTLPLQPSATLRHDLNVALEIKNLTDQPHQVIITEGGPVGLTSEGGFGPDQKVCAAFRDNEGVVDLVSHTFKDVGKHKSISLYKSANQDFPLIWYGGGNLFFTCIACPVDAEGKATVGTIASIDAVDIGDSTATEDVANLRIVSEPLELAPGSTKTLSKQLFLGPKDREAFESTANGDYIRRDYISQIKEGYGSCTFTFLTDWMIRLLNWLESIFHNFGVAIIFLVIIVRTLLHPVTKKTQINMVKMQQDMGRLQPKMEEIKKRHAGDNAKIQQETMALYREEGMNPLGQMLTCLPMLLQMPIWVALYSGLRNNVAMRGRGFCLWINDLTVPDNLLVFDTPLFGKIESFHLLPILVGVMMFAQQKLMPKAKKDPKLAKSATSEQAEQMTKMMPYMSLMMIFLFYKFPSGLNLYIMTSSLIGAAEQVYIRKHISKKDLEGPKPKVVKPKKTRTHPSLLERLQKKAEEAQKSRDMRQPGKRKKDR